METTAEATLSRKVHSIGELTLLLEACATLGLRDVTVTTVTRGDSRLLVSYHLDAKQVEL